MALGTNERIYQKRLPEFLCTADGSVRTAVKSSPVSVRVGVIREVHKNKSPK